MKSPLASKIALLIVGTIITGCGTISSELVKSGSVKIVTEDTARTGIDQVRVWEGNGNVVVTGRVVQQGYGMQIRGHVDIEIEFPNDRPRATHRGELQRRNGLSRTLKVSSFRSELGNENVSDALIRVRYHDKGHENSGADKKSS